MDAVAVPDAFAGIPELAVCLIGSGEVEQPAGGGIELDIGPGDGGGTYRVAVDAVLSVVASVDAAEEMMSS